MQKPSHSPSGHCLDWHSLTAFRHQASRPIQQGNCTLPECHSGLWSLCWASLLHGPSLTLVETLLAVAAVVLVAVLVLPVVVAAAVVVNPQDHLGMAPLVLLLLAEDWTLMLVHGEL